MSLPLSLPLALAALIIEALIGYPAPLYRAIGHPVTWMGRWLAWLEADPQSRRRQLRRAPGGGRRRALPLSRAGRACRLGGDARSASSVGALGFAALALLAASLPAQRSLAVHVSAVAEGLDAGLDEGRRAVAKIVGRNPDVLDEAGVARAAIESLAENFSDGVVAPILWTALGGLVGGALYKAINTADSMIGHKDERLPCLRLGGGAARRSRQSAGVASCRAVAHSGRLARPRAPRRATRRAPYGATRRVIARPTPAGPKRRWPARSVSSSPDRASMERRWSMTRSWESGRREADAADIRRALRLFTRACAIQAVTLLAALAILLAGNAASGRG